MSSRYEGFGLVLIETMSCGLPCISFNCPYGPKNIIRDKHDGLLVNSEEIDKLKDSIELLTDDTVTRIKYGSNALSNIKRYNKDAIMGQWIILFDRIQK